MKRYVLTQFWKGCLEVHVIFDNPGQLQNTPKFFKHMRRDVAATLKGDHSCAIQLWKEVKEACIVFEHFMGTQLSGI